MNNEQGFKAVIARPKDKENSNSAFVESNNAVSSGVSRSANYGINFQNQLVLVFFVEDTIQ